MSGGLSIDRMIILKCILKGKVVRCRLDSSDSRWGSLASYFKHDSAPSDSIKVVNVLTGSADESPVLEPTYPPLLLLHCSLQECNPEVK
jgi:hypothetical protein